MASQNLNVGTAANANDGDTLRAAFIKVKQMFAEVYGQTYSEQGDLSGVTFEIKEDKLKATNTAVDGYVLTYDSGTGGFTWEQKFDGDITSIVAGDGLTGDATSGDASLAVGAGDGITVNANDVALDSSVAGSGLTYTSGVLSVDAIDTANITNDAVTHAKLENRYTAKATSSSTGSQNLDASAASTFLLTGNITTATLTIQNMKLGQSIDIILSGTLTSAVITLADDFTTSTISKVGATDLDTAETNIIQVICLDDTDSAAKLVYSINKYETDTTP